jgi:hypothetical protein
MITLVGMPDPVMSTGVLGLGVFLGLPFAIHESGILATTHISIMVAFKELLKFEHVGLNHSVLFSMIYAVSLWLSEEHLFTKLAAVGYLHTMTMMSFMM